jgi:hypothetical protein
VKDENEVFNKDDDEQTVLVEESPKERRSIDTLQDEVTEERESTEVSTRNKRSAEPGYGHGGHGGGYGHGGGSGQSHGHDRIFGGNIGFGHGRGFSHGHGGFVHGKRSIDNMEGNSEKSQKNVRRTAKHPLSTSPLFLEVKYL